MKKFYFLTLSMIIMLVFIGAKCPNNEDENENVNTNENINENVNANENINEEVESGVPFFVGDWTFFTSGVSEETGDYGEIWNVITVNEGEEAGDGHNYFGIADSKIAHVYVESEKGSVFVSNAISGSGKYIVTNDKYFFMFNQNMTFNGRFESEDYAIGRVQNLKTGKIIGFTAMKENPEDLVVWLEAAYEGSHVLDMVEDDALVDWIQTDIDEIIIEDEDAEASE